MSLNYDVGSDSQDRYFPSKYFNPQLITLWVQCAEVSEGLVVELGGGGLEARGGGCLIGLAHSSCQRHALFSKGIVGRVKQGDLRSELLDGGRCWLRSWKKATWVHAWGTDSRTGAYTSTKPPANKCVWLIRDVTQFVIDLNVKSEV